jgi:hypothetical protein
VNEPVIGTLLAAVPSFAAPWAAHLADEAEYTARFPGSSASDAETEFEFFCRLARHLGERLCEHGGLQEVSAALSALEPLYLHADEELAGRLTVTLLEGVILAAHDCHGPLPALDAAAAESPPLVAAEYESARRYLRGAPGSAGTCWVRD